MKKIIIAFGLGLSFFTFSIVAADYPQSGVDLDLSTVIINLIPGAGSAGYSCSAVGKGTAISFNVAGWEDGDGDGNGEFTGLAACFDSAGIYTLDIRLQDNAGNFNNYIETFTILAGTPDLSESSLEGVCDSETANNVDECTFTLILKDVYGNTITNQAPRVHSPTSDFGDDANTGDVKFRGGLQVEGDNNSYATLPYVTGSGADIKSDGTFNLKASAPSIQKVVDGGFAGDFLSRVVSRTVNFVFTGLKKVNLDGFLGADLNGMSFDKSIKFLNPFYSKPSIDGDLIHEALVGIAIETNKENGGATSASGLLWNTVDLIPSLCEKNAETNEFELCGEDFSSATLLANFPETIPANPAKYLDEPSGAIVGNDSIALITYLSYTLGGVNISYPAGAIGGMFEDLNPDNIIGLNAQDAAIKFIGADIEGFVSVDESKSVLGAEGDEILNIGLNSNETDIYEKIVKNGWGLVRNSANIITTNSGGDNLSTLFGNNDVVVVKLDSGITFDISGSLPIGKKTLVLVDANLKITGNLVYQNNNDSFGVIVLRTSAGTYPEVGNIFTASSVQKIAGSFFADGGFMNNTGTTINTGNIENNISTYQLLLTGSLLSRNTMGGSLRGADENGNTLIDYTPWGEIIDTSISRRYDLHYVRRYNSTAAGHTGIGDGETNSAAFIIRPDQKATVLPPPGFRLQ